MNIIVEYLYRDAGNNKIWGEASFTNELKIDLSTLKFSIKRQLIDGEYFYAEKAGLPALCFDKYDEDLDHGWHEFYDLTESEKTTATSRDILDFISALGH